MTTRYGRQRPGDIAARRDHYTELTNQIIAALEAGTPPWRRPWDSGTAASPTMPRNAITGTPYRGINVLTLTLSPLAFTSGDPRWATYKQAAERGWQVKKGSHGTTAYFFKRLEVPNTSNDENRDDGSATKRVPLLRAFTLFHASQIEGIPDFIPPSTTEAPWRAPEAAEIIVTNSAVPVRIGGDRAFYTIDADYIQMPPRQAFCSAGAWASTILHELAHASAHASRLDRDIRTRFGSSDYAREELRAEIAQVMVCAELGIAECEFSNGAAYLASWLETLRNDRKEIFRAAAEAQRIADWLLNHHPESAACHCEVHSPDASDGAPAAAERQEEFAKAA